jgi:peptidoglycan/LPS O-acetylase OafA/YrhL
VALLVVATATRTAHAWLDLPAAFNYLSTFSRLDGIAVGGLLGWWLHQHPEGVRRGRLFVAGGVLLALASVRWLQFPWYSTLDRSWSDLAFYPLAALAAGMLVLGIYRTAGKATGLLAWPPLLYLGRISYGLYVFHVASQFAIVLHPRARDANVLVKMGLSLGLTVVCASLSYALLERPFLRWKRRFTWVASRDER